MMKATGGVLVSLLALSTVDCGVVTRLGQPKIMTLVYVASPLRNKSKD